MDRRGLRDRRLQQTGRCRRRLRRGGHPDAGGRFDREAIGLRIVLLGGRGQVGSRLGPLLDNQAHEVALASRDSDVRADLVTGEGLADAVADADAVVLLASNPRDPSTVDLKGTRNLLRVLGDQHLIYLSIVGVDRHPLPYYRAKYQAEQMIADSGRSYSILRATQFHSFVEWRLRGWCHRRLALVPGGYVFQPVAVEEVAAELAAITTGPPRKLVPDFAGPEILSIEVLARAYMTALGHQTPLLSYPKPGPVASGYRRGMHTNPDQAVGVTTWPDYLAGRFG